MSSEPLCGGQLKHLFVRSNSSRHVWPPSVCKLPAHCICCLLLLAAFAGPHDGDALQTFRRCCHPQCLRHWPLLRCCSAACCLLLLGGRVRP